ncbi:hypothetical protein GCM10009099_33110 [Caenispirillum bisanense]
MASAGDRTEASKPDAREARPPSPTLWVFRQYEAEPLPKDDFRQDPGTASLRSNCMKTQKDGSENMDLRPDRARLHAKGRMADFHFPHG